MPVQSEVSSYIFHADLASWVDQNSLRSLVHAYYYPQQKAFLRATFSQYSTQPDSSDLVSNGN